MSEGSEAPLHAKREYTQLLRLHEQLLGEFARARDQLTAPGTDGLVKQIKGRTGTAPDLSEVKTSVEEAIKRAEDAIAALKHDHDAEEVAHLQAMIGQSTAKLNLKRKRRKQV